MGFEFLVLAETLPEIREDSEIWSEVYGYYAVFLHSKPTTYKE